MSTDTDQVALIRSRAQALYARDLACQTAGIQLDDVAAGRASLRMRVTGTMVNGHGMAHGGRPFPFGGPAFADARHHHGPRPRPPPPQRAPPPPPPARGQTR